jgi:hypothetical protein
MGDAKGFARNDVVCHALIQVERRMVVVRVDVSFGYCVRGMRSWSEVGLHGVWQSICVDTELNTTPHSGKPCRLAVLTGMRASVESLIHHSLVRIRMVITQVLVVTRLTPCAGKKPSLESCTRVFNCYGQSTRCGTSAGDDHWETGSTGMSGWEI